MISKKQRANAERIKVLAETFGHLPLNDSGQTPEALLNLSIPCARLVIAGVVTGVADTYDGINDGAVADVERCCRNAVDYATAQHGAGWWTERAAELFPATRPLPLMDATSDNPLEASIARARANL